MSKPDPDGDLVPANDRKELLERALGKRQCRATSKHSGQQCQRPPIIGGFVCRFHGGGTPQAKDAARARLRALVDPAIDALTRTIGLAYNEQCPTCKGPDSKMMAVVVKASQLVLDRCGYGPKKTLEVTGDTGLRQWAKYLTDEQLDTIQGWIADAKARAESAEVIDAEATVVEDSNDVEGD